MADTIETTWDKLPEMLQQRLRLLEKRRRNRHVKMVIFALPDEDVMIVHEVEAHPQARKAQAEQWVRRFRAYAQSHAPLPHEVDDSRDTIYAEAVRDPG